MVSKTETVVVVGDSVVVVLVTISTTFFAVDGRRAGVREKGLEVVVGLPVELVMTSGSMGTENVVESEGINQEVVIVVCKAVVLIVVVVVEVVVDVVGDVVEVTQVDTVVGEVEVVCGEVDGVVVLRVVLRVGEERRVVLV